MSHDLADLEYFEQTHTLYAADGTRGSVCRVELPAGSQGRKDYKGGILWHEGEFRFKKDCTLQGAVPIPLLWSRCPTDVSKTVGTNFIVTDGERLRGSVWCVGEEARSSRRSHPAGRIRRNDDHAGRILRLVGPGGHGFRLRCHALRSRSPNLQPSSWFHAGIGRAGQKVTAGTVLKYRFGVGTFADEVAGNALLEHTVKAMNLGGGQAGYPVEMKTGTVADAVFFFTASAKRTRQPSGSARKTS